MPLVNEHRWRQIERWSPRLFVLAAVCLVVGAANSGLAFLFESYTFNGWLGIVLELGRLAALLGTVGVSMQIMERHERLGGVTRAIASLAVVFVTVLTAMATLTVAGVLAEPIGVIGLLAYGLSVSAFLAAGAAVVWTGAHPRLVGGLLLVNVAALLVVFFGRLFVPLELVAAVIPGGQVLLYLGVGYSIQGRSVTNRWTTPATDTTLR